MEMSKNVQDRIRETLERNKGKVKGTATRPGEAERTVDRVEAALNRRLPKEARMKEVTRGCREPGHKHWKPRSWEPVSGVKISGYQRWGTCDGKLTKVNVQPHQRNKPLTYKKS